MQGQGIEATAARTWHPVGAFRFVLRQHLHGGWWLAVCSVTNIRLASFSLLGSDRLSSHRRVPWHHCE